MVVKFSGRICLSFLSALGALQFFYFYYVFIYWLCWAFVAVQALSLVAESGGCSLVAVHGLLIAGTSLVAEHRL